jgi:hypothetical protein
LQQSYVSLVGNAYIDIYSIFIFIMKNSFVDLLFRKKCNGSCVWMQCLTNSDKKPISNRKPFIPIHCNSFVSTIFTFVIFKTNYRVCMFTSCLTLVKLRKHTTLLLGTAIVNPQITCL